MPDGTPRVFVPETLSKYWCDNCNFDLVVPDVRVINALGELKALGMKLCLFTNGPKEYAKIMLKQLSLDQIFEPEHFFGVEDVLPHCKPEAEAFNKVLAAAGCRPEASLMVSAVVIGVSENS